MLKEYGFTYVGGMWVGPNNPRARAVARKYGGYMPPEIKQSPWDVDMEDFPPALIRQLAGYFKNKEQLGSGARKTLRKIWSDYGQPGEDLNDWIESTLQPRFVNLTP